MKKQKKVGRLSVSQKVFKVRQFYGSRRVVVDLVRSTSVSSWKRWEHRECKPVAAHKNLIDKTYDRMSGLKGALLRKIERRLERERLGNSHGEKKWDLKWCSKRYSKLELKRKR